MQLPAVLDGSTAMLDGLRVYHDYAGQTPYFKAMGKRQAPFFAGKPKVTMLQTVGNSTGAHSKL